MMESVPPPIAMPSRPTNRVPDKVVLFSGHMLDSPGRETPRFPAEKEPVARAAIVAELARLAAGPADLAVSSAACGGDLLFAEAAFARGLAVEIYLPFEPGVFADRSVDFAGADWPARFAAACSAAALHLMPTERAGSVLADDPFEQNNLWMIEAASRFGLDKVDFIVLWDGRKGDGPGGTEHLMESVRRRGGRTHWLDTRRLWA